MKFIDLKAQYEAYREEIDARIHGVLNHGQYILGPEVNEVERKLEEVVGISHCIAVGSGTVSLEIALRALNIGPGDEVITVPFTFIATAEVIMALGATPVFVDIRPDSFNMNPELLPAAITERTKAIIPVGLFGQMAEMERIEEVAVTYGITVIEDAAQCFGATRHNSRSCSVSRMASTSFYPAKVLGCYGDGGALFTDDEELAMRIRAIANHGITHEGKFECVGLNARFDTMQAAVLLAKIPHFEGEIAKRKLVADRYSERLPQSVELPKTLEGNTHVFAQYTIRSRNRDGVCQRLQELGIPVSIHYPKCIHEQPAYSDLGYAIGSFEESEKAARQVLSLPMHPFLSEEDQDQIIDAVETVSNCY